IAGGQSFPSGDGIDGGDFEIDFQILPGKAGSDDVVALDDFRILKDSFGESGIGLPADFDANGSVGLEDFRVLKDGFGTSAVAQPHFQLDLAETNSISMSASLPVELGQRSGSRSVSLSLDAVFDKQDQ